MQLAPPIPRPAYVLGWLGVIPFAAFALLAATGTNAPLGPAKNLLVLYGAIILSFMGGAQWGLAIAPGQHGSAATWSRLAISVLPALAAFALTLTPSNLALLGLAAAFAALLIYDIRVTHAGFAPAWYAALRLQLTGAVVTCLVIAAFLVRP